MEEDELLRALGSVARDEPALDPRWDAYAAGELSDEEVASLRAEAEQSAEGRALLAAFAPLESSVLEAVAAQARESLAGAAPAEPAAGVGAGAEVVQLAARRRLFLPVALAASVMLTVGVLLNQQLAYSPDVLPAYAVELTGQVQTLRGAEDEAALTREVQAFATGNTLRLVLTPEVSVEGELGARIFLRRDGTVVPLRSPSPKVAASGAVLLEGVVGTEIALPPGASELLIVIGDPRALPGDETLANSLSGQSAAVEAGWSAWALALQVD